MASDLLLYPTFSGVFEDKVRFQKRKYEFYYTDRNGEFSPLIDEAVDANSSVHIIKDETGGWDQDNCNIGFSRKFKLDNLQCLFGSDGIACEDALLGIAVRWTSADSRQRGIVPAGTFSADEPKKVFEVEKVFDRAQLRGDIRLETVIYIAESGNPKQGESHLANTAGMILGELDDPYTFRLDGTGSLFPIYDVYADGQPLWFVECSWDDPTSDKMESCVSININRAHKGYRYLDRESSQFDSQILSEVIASAVTVIIEKARSEEAYWAEIIDNQSLEDGSVGQAINYFKDSLGWDLTDALSVSLSARKFFDQRIKK